MVSVCVCVCQVLACVFVRACVFVWLWISKSKSTKESNVCRPGKRVSHRCQLSVTESAQVCCPADWPDGSTHPLPARQRGYACRGCNNVEAKRKQTIHCLCLVFCFCFAPTGSVRGPAEDLRGLCRDPGQRHAGPAFEHYDPQVLAVLQAQQSKDKVRNKENMRFCYWGQARREVLLFTLLVFRPNSDPFDLVQF